MTSHATAELSFELPPKLSWPVERRLAGHAVSAWRAACRNGKLPAAVDFERGELALACANSSVRLVASADGVHVVHVGVLVATAFRLAIGHLFTAEPLGARLNRAFAELREVRIPVSFEAKLGGVIDDAALLLTRSVLLPLLDEAGALTQALAIITWKEVLGATARDRLQSEIGGAITAARAAQHSRGRQLSGALHGAFTPARTAGSTAPFRPGR